jgi:hypothetical protein
MFRCSDCEVDTSAIEEYYMVKDVVWVEANKDLGLKVENDGHPNKTGLTSHDEGRMLCIGCLEVRLGREVTRDDFEMHIPINAVLVEIGSERIKDRIKIRSK